jgi:hypothetical protein
MPPKKLKTMASDHDHNSAGKVAKLNSASTTETLAAATLRKTKAKTPLGVISTDPLFVGDSFEATVKHHYQPEMAEKVIGGVLGCRGNALQIFGIRVSPSKSITFDNDVGLSCLAALAVDCGRGLHPDQARTWYVGGDSCTWAGTTQQGVANFLTHVGQSQWIVSLNLKRMPLGANGATALANLLRTSRTLERLYVAHCGIDTSGFEAMVAALVESDGCPLLKSIDVEGNPFYHDASYAEHCGRVASSRPLLKIEV